MNLDAGFGLFLQASLRGAVLVLVLLGLRRLLRRQVPAAAWAAGWVVVAAVWLIPLAVPAGWSPANLYRSRPRAEPAGRPVIPAEQPRLAEAPRLRVAAPAPMTATLRSAPQPVWNVYALAWLAGAMVLIGARLATGRRFAGQLDRQARPTDDRVSSAASRVARELGMTSIPELVTTPLVDTPALFGIVRPRLLLPCDLAERLSDAELCWVMLHELGHCRRRDLWSLAVLQLSVALHWFNPLAWLALRLGREDVELACDEFVLSRARGAEPAAYGEVLLRLASPALRRTALWSVVGIAEPRRRLQRRITMIINYAPMSLRRVALGVTMLGGFALVGFTQEKRELAPPPAAPEPARTTTTESRPASAPAKLFGLDYDRPSGVPEARAQAAEWESTVKLELRAMGLVGGEPVALVDVEGEPMLTNSTRGFRSLQVKSIDVEAHELVLVGRGGAVRSLRLEHPREIKFPDVHAEMFLSPEGLARRRQRAEAARGYGLEPVVMSWPKLNREAKEELLMNYLRTGELLQIFVIKGSGVTASSGFLFERQLMEQRAAARQRFVATLSPAQLADYRQSALPAARIGQATAQLDGMRTRAREAAIHHDRFVESLTAEQRALYEEYAGGPPIKATPLPAVNR